MSRFFPILSFALPLLVGALLLDGCAGSGSATDSGMPRDARIADGSLVVDSSQPHDASAADAGLADGATACGGHCDPVMGRCAVGVCLLDRDGPRCAATGGLVMAGGRCAALSDCATGLACFLTRAGGVCSPVCCPASDAGGSTSCGADERCGGSGALVEGTVTAYRRCIGPRPCDVLEPEAACDRGEGCYIVDDAGATDCRVAGAASGGEACVDPNDCAPGFACSGSFARSCVRVCSLRSDGVPCPTGEGTCVALAQSPPGTGLCTVASPALR